MKRRNYKQSIQQPSLFGRLRHIEQALVREIELLTSYERKLVLPELLATRESIREINDKLTALDEKRRTRNS